MLLYVKRVVIYWVYSQERISKVKFVYDHWTRFLWNKTENIRLHSISTILKKMNYIQAIFSANILQLKKNPNGSLHWHLDSFSDMSRHVKVKTLKYFGKMSKRNFSKFDQLVNKIMEKFKKHVDLPERPPSFCCHIFGLKLLKLAYIESTCVVNFEIRGCVCLPVGEVCNNKAS